MDEYKPEKKEIEISLNLKKKKTLIFWSVVFVLLVLIGGFLWWRFFFTDKGVIFDLEYPEYVMSGEPFALIISVNNQSHKVLSNAKIVLKAENGCYDRNFKEASYLEIPLGNIGKKGSREEKKEFIIVAKPGVIKHFSALLTWKTSGFRVGLQKQKEFDISITRPALSVGLSLPKKVIPNIPFNLEITYKNNLAERLEDAFLQIQTPLEYKFQEANPPVEDLSKIKLDSLLPNQQKRLIITGYVLGQSKQAFNFEVKAGLNKNNQDFVLDSQKGTISLLPSLLPLDVSVNGSKDYVAELGDMLTYTINYTNKTEVALSDVILKAKLSGDLFDFSTLATDGYFNSKDNTIIWNGGNHPDLKLIGAGETGSVSFRIELKDNFPFNFAKKDYNLKVSVQIESLSVPYYVAADRLTNNVDFETKVAGDIDFDCLAFFRDAKSGFINNGPWPPKVNQETEFTIHFRLRNYATDVKNVQIKAVLANGVVYKNKYKEININPEIKYNKRTKELFLTIPSISAWDGIATLPKEFIFQVGLTPALNQLGESVPLIKNISLQAQDVFTNVSFVKKCNILETGTIYKFDKTVKQSEGSVVR